MEIMLDGQLVTCTPEEYIELKRLGAFGDKPAEQGTTPKLGDGYDEWLTRGRTQVVAVYGCNIPGSLTCSGDSSDASNKVGKTRLSADTMSRLDAVVGNTPMLDGKYIFNPNTCTPGTETCGRCQREEYCEKGFVAKKKAYQDRQRLAARPTIVKLDNPEIDPAGGYFHYFKLDKDGKTMLNDNELEPWMVDAAISEKTYDSLGGK